MIETFGHPTIIPSHGSLNLGGQATVEVIFTLILIAVLLSLWIGFARGPAEAPGSSAMPPPASSRS